MTVREIALSLLNEYEIGGKYVNLSLSSHKADSLSREDRGFLTALLYTAVERKITYDYLIGAISSRGNEKIDITTLNILRLGMAQLLDMDSVPSHAAVNETVKLARNPGERGFVNGVLRQTIRLKDSGELPMPKREKNAARYLSVKHSFPLWMAKHFVKLFGESDTEKLFERFNTARYTDLTVNLSKISRDDFISLLGEKEFSAECGISSLTVRLNESVNPKLLPGFEEGYFFVQDSASAIAAEALGAAVGDHIVDVCACPGGKSFAAAIFAGADCSVTSFDIHESKLSLVIDGAKRLGLNNVVADACDATNPREELYGSFDRVICDAPCSGLGVLAKKPDIRHKDNESLQELPKLQLDILEKSAKYLKNGGYMIYSTCTLNPMENENVVNEFLRSNPEYSLCDFTVGGIASSGGMLTLLPHVHGTDGFFIAKIKKEKYD